MRLLICAGGTGGGVYPALAVLQALEDRLSEVLWVGGEGGMEAELVKRLNIPFTSIPAAGLHGVGLLALPGNLWKLLCGVFSAQKVLRTFQPDVILYTGGFVAAPLAIAAWKIPSVLYVPDIEPGLALKSLAQFASKIALTSETSKAYYKDSAKLSVSGYPTRKDLLPSDKADAYARFNLHTRQPVVLFFGGSKGARSINRAVLQMLTQILQQAQVIHITGKLDWQEVQQTAAQLHPGLLANYHAYPYLHEDMGAAFSAADLVVSRAGASCLGEFPLFGLPAVLVPYPYAWRYQKVNAQYLVDHDAAVMIKDEDLQAELLPLVEKLIANPHRLAKMRVAMRNLHQPDAAKKIADQILTLYSRRQSERGSL